MFDKYIQCKICKNISLGILRFTYDSILPIKLQIFLFRKFFCLIRSLQLLCTIDFKLKYVNIKKRIPYCIG